MTATIGSGVSRVDGRAKVTGEAKYAAEHSAPDLTYGFVVSSTIAKGKITSIDTREALALPGVLQVFTHENRPSLAWFDRKYKDDVAPGGSPFRPLYDAHIIYSGQPIALVVAESFEVARFAATLIDVTYEQDAHETDLEAHLADARDPKSGKAGFAPPPKPRGTPDESFGSAPVTIDAEYTTPVEHHNPMEPHATTVVWEDGGKLTIYDKTQGVLNSQQYVCNIFGLSTDDVTVRAPFVGGGFGSGLRPQYQLFLAVLAATELHRSVRLSLTRQQMFTFGHRPTTWQRVRLAADSNGTLQAVLHDAISETSRFEDHVEVIVNWSGALYKCANVKLTHKVLPLDVYTPLDMRAPGAASGIYALESAMDELAYALHIDPLELRLKNYVDYDQNDDKPYSSKELREAYRQGAERFGWGGRTMEPGSMRRGTTRIGWGMASGMWDSGQQKASAKLVLNRDGSATISSATADIGTGTYTIMAQIVSDMLGLPIDRITAQLGDTALPPAPVEGGSWTAASVGTAVMQACDSMRKTLFRAARRMEESPFSHRLQEHMTFADGAMHLTDDTGLRVSYADVMDDLGVASLEEQADASPNILKQRQFSPYSHCATFAEVEVDEDYGTVRVTRVVSAIAGGRILNAKTARSQILGCVVWGIGMALEEESVLDHQFGRFMNHSLAEYHVPVNADIGEIDVIFVEEQDSVVNPLGVKGLGEVGMVGVAAAIANAVYHATGKRVRDLPITLDKIIAE